ncbi:MAG: hypothetical protein ACOZB1_18995 [Pseudomonadota bacterium]|jgi:hypothetical protein
MRTARFPVNSPHRAVGGGRVSHSLAVALVALATALLASGCASGGAVRSGLLQEQIRNARTAADHEALAQYFQAQAAESRAKADHHRKLAETYETAPAYRYGRGVGRGPAAHCESIARRYQDLEKEQLAMADLHKRLAAEAGSSK